MKKWYLQDQDYILWWVLGQARDTLYLVRNKELREDDITPRQVSVLFVIKVLEDMEGKATLGKIAEWLLNEPHTVSRIVSRMVKVGLLKKVKDPDQGNELKISLTERGERAYQETIKSEAIHEVISALSKQDRQQLYSSLIKIRDTALEKIKAKNIPFP